MLIFREFFKTHSDQNIHQNAPHFPNFLGGASIYMHQHMRATIFNMYFCMKIAIFYSRLL